MRNQNQKDDDSSDGPQHAKEIETTGEIMQRAEKRKKFLRNIIKTTPAHFATLKYVFELINSQAYLLNYSHRYSCDCNVFPSVSLLVLKPLVHFHYGSSYWGAETLQGLLLLLSPFNCCVSAVG